MSWMFRDKVANFVTSDAALQHFCSVFVTICDVSTGYRANQMGFHNMADAKLSFL